MKVLVTWCVRHGIHVDGVDMHRVNEEEGSASQEQREKVMVKCEVLSTMDDRVSFKFKYVFESYYVSIDSFSPNFVVLM